MHISEYQVTTHKKKALYTHPESININFSKPNHKETSYKLAQNWSIFSGIKSGKKWTKLEEETSLNMEIRRPESCSSSAATAAIGAKGGSKGYNEDEGRRRTDDSRE